MNAKISVFVICVKTIIYLLLYNLYDCTLTVLNLYNLKNLLKQNTCFKIPDKTICIDLILTNCPRSFQNTDTFEIGLLYFHKLTFTVLKQYSPKQKPKVVIHRQNKNFRNNYFSIKLENALLKYACFGQACSNKEKNI